MARLFLAVALLSGSLLLGGCAEVSNFYHTVTETTPSQDVAVSERPPQSLYNFKMGREYAAQGRYELAKEHYLMALASSGDAQTRDLVTHELHAVDLMIQTQR